MACGEGGRVCSVIWSVDRVVGFAQLYGVGRGWECLLSGMVWGEGGRGCSVIRCGERVVGCAQWYGVWRVW